MFLPFNQPQTQKMTLYRRSKTITVIKNTEKKNSFSLNSKKFYSQKPNYKSTTAIKNHTQPIKDPDDKKKFRSLRTMTETIQCLINRQLCYSHLLTHVERNSNRLKMHQNQNPEGQEFNDDFYREKNKKTLETSTSGFREPEYLTLLKKTQRFNLKAFVPHFNWKQKLTRMKNLGNYGHVYKKKEKNFEKKFTPPPQLQEIRQEYVKDYVIDSTKIIIEPQIIISRGIGVEQKRHQRRMSACKRCQTSCTEYPSERDRKNNLTFFVGERLHSRNFSHAKPILDEKTVRKGKSVQRDWQFQPWDVKRDN